MMMEEALESGHVKALFVCPQPEEPMQRVPMVEAQEGRGLLGDRYFAPEGAEIWAIGQLREKAPRHDVTLFAYEDIEAGRRDSEVDIDPLDMRRNILTTGFSLRDRVGCFLRVGDVVIEVLKENPPCAHLQRLAGKPLLKPMVRGGGVRGRIAQGGVIREGDVVVALRTPADGDSENDVWRH